MPLVEVVAVCVLEEDVVVSDAVVLDAVVELAVAVLDEPVLEVEVDVRVPVVSVSVDEVDVTVEVVAVEVWVTETVVVLNVTDEPDDVLVVPVAVPVLEDCVCEDVVLDDEDKLEEEVWELVAVNVIV